MTRPLRVLILGPYPIDKPKHGGQLRANAIAEAYRRAGFECLYISVSHLESHGSSTTGIGRNQINIGLSLEVLRQYDPSPFAYLMTDMLSAQAAVSDKKVFARIRKAAQRFKPDCIQIEQAWMWPIAKELLAGGSGEPAIIYSSHNIEYELKRDILSKAGAPCLAAIDKIKEMEEDLAKAADLTLAVTHQDGEKLRAMGANNVEIAPNASKVRIATAEKCRRWKKRLGPTPFGLFVGSGHPPNGTGFMHMLGPGLGFLRPDRIITVVGSVAHLFDGYSDFQRFSGLNDSHMVRFPYLPDADLDALFTLCSVILLPITEGGGSNLKTAEALLSGKPIVATSTAFRGYERYASLPNIIITNDPAQFKKSVAGVLNAAKSLPPSTDPRPLPELTWHGALARLPHILQHTIKPLQFQELS